MVRPLADGFAANAGLFPHLLDIASDQILLSHMDEQAFRQASFLDQRIFTPQLKRQLLPWRALDDAVLPSLPQPHYIFHIGHVGSTLISRLLGEFENCLALREPLLLRSLAEISQIVDEPQSPWSPQQYSARSEQVISWLSRRFHEKQRPMIKASSFASVLAPQLISASNKALFLYVPLQSYLQTILAGEASMQETQAMAGQRLVRLTHLLGEAPAKLWQLSPVQRTAMSWLCEMATLQSAFDGPAKQQIIWHSFDDFLAAPEANLAQLVTHFELTAPSDANVTNQIAALVNGPIMSHYSKAPEHGYSAGLRRDLQREAQSKYSNEIRAAMDWVDDLAKRYPNIAALLSRP